MHCGHEEFKWSKHWAESQNWSAEIYNPQSSLTVYSSPVVFWTKAKDEKKKSSELPPTFLWFSLTMLPSVKFGWWSRIKLDTSRMLIPTYKWGLGGGLKKKHVKWFLFPAEKNICCTICKRDVWSVTGTEEEAIGVRRRRRIRGKLLAGMNLQTETWRSGRSLSLSQGEGHRNIKSLRKYCSTPRMSHWQPPELWGRCWWWCFENPLELRFSSLLQMGYIIAWAPATPEIPHNSGRTYRISCQRIRASNPLAKSSSQGEKLLFLLGGLWCCCC